MDPAKAPAAIEFGRFRVLPHRRELLAEGLPLDLGGRAFDVLMVLIEASGAVVSKDALMDRVWPDRVVEENSLQAQISALRRAFAADRDLIRHDRRARLPIYRRDPHGLGKPGSAAGRHGCRLHLRFGAAAH
jgi:DNA-binding response OmpR family regulator